MPEDQPIRRQILQRSAVILLAAALLLATLSLTAADDEPPAAGAATARGPVIVELFTSQGCSSCPPADRLIGRLAREDGSAPVIPLSFHVDYWNYIGWTDPFSSREWSQRQSDYAESFGSSRVYTPQVVINGHTELVGSNETRVRSAIAKASRTPAAGHLALDLRPGPASGRLELEIAARVERAAGECWSVMVAVVENDLETPVKRGENGGRTLHNTRVVRSLAEAFTVPARPGTERTQKHVIELEDDWQRGKLGVAVFLQDPDSRQIHGAAAVQLPG